ncbi:MAG: hypothetical protein AAFS07_19035, partial [Pseudomonadota bacterium]
VVVFRCFCVWVGWSLLDATVARLYDGTTRTFNDVPIDDYQHWLDQDLLDTRYVMLHYFQRSPVLVGAMTGDGRDDPAARLDFSRLLENLGAARCRPDPARRKKRRRP